VNGRARVVLVTGASSGIGRACARLLAQRGHRVFGTFRRPPADPGEEGFTPVTMEATDDASVQASVAQVLREAGRVDVVVNNAGYSLVGAVEDTSLAEAQRQMDTNFFGVLRVCREVLPVMRGQRDGLIVNVSSLGGLFGLPFQGLYAASKFALEGLTESLRHEVAPFGVRVTLIEPGDLRTSITDKRVRAAAADGRSAYADAFRRALSVIEREERGGPPPEVVAALVLRLLAVRAPRVRYTVGHLSQRSSAWARAWVPEGLFESAIRRYFGR
jgi:NAD(P)-dependent dehydrogenase (short-subunit alcohol dehydrogenase family)